MGDRRETNDFYPDSRTVSACPEKVEGWEAHLKDYENPHRVTAAQVGTLAEAVIRALVQEALQEAMAYADRRTVSVYRHVGSVDTVEDLPDTAVDGNVYNVRADGMNYVWLADEQRWDALGPTLDLTGYSTTAEADARYVRKGVSGAPVTNVLDDPIRLIHRNHSGELHPVLLAGSQFTDGTNYGNVTRDDRQCMALWWNKIEFQGAPGVTLRTLSFQPDNDDSIVRRAELLAEVVKYLPLTGGTVTGAVTFAAKGNYMESLDFGGAALDAGLKTRGICGRSPNGGKGGLFINYDGGEVSTEEYFAPGSEGRGVFIGGGTDVTNKGCQVLRKMDGDAFYLAKAGGTMDGPLVLGPNAWIEQPNGAKVFYQEGASTHVVTGYLNSYYWPILGSKNKPINELLSPTLVAGDNVTLEPQADGTVKVSATGGGEAYTLPVATDTTLGGVKIPAYGGFDFDVDGTLWLRAARSGELGGIKVHPDFGFELTEDSSPYGVGVLKPRLEDNLYVSSEGRIGISNASATGRGVVKVGAGLSIRADGTLDLDQGGLEGDFHVGRLQVFFTGSDLSGYVRLVADGFGDVNLATKAYVDGRPSGAALSVTHDTDAVVSVGTDSFECHAQEDGSLEFVMADGSASPTLHKVPSLAALNALAAKIGDIDAALAAI